MSPAASDAALRAEQLFARLEGYPLGKALARIEPAMSAHDDASSEAPVA